MVIMSCCCCFSFITLCCGFDFSRKIKIVGVVGFTFLAIGLILYILWLALGSYLIGLFGVRALFATLCRKIVAYVIFMYIYLLFFLVAMLAAILWSIFGSRDDKSKKGRDSAKSKPKMPPTKMLTAMV